METGKWAHRLDSMEFLAQVTRWLYQFVCWGLGRVNVEVILRPSRTTYDYLNLSPMMKVDHASNRTDQQH